MRSPYVALWTKSRSCCTYYQRTHCLRGVAVVWRLLNAVCAHHVAGADCVNTTTVEAWCPIDSTGHRSEGKDLHTRLPLLTPLISYRYGHWGMVGYMQYFTVVCVNDGLPVGPSSSRLDCLMHCIGQIAHSVILQAIQHWNWERQQM